MRLEKHGLTALALLLMLLLLAGCSSDGDGFNDTTTDPDITGPDPTDPSVVDIGSGTSTSFVSGVLTVAVTSLSAGGSTSVTANLVDAANGSIPYLGVTDVQFTSVCAGSGLASLSSPVNTSTGVAISTYTASGCSITDTITAIATIDGGVISAAGSVTVAPAVVGSLLNVSVERVWISLKGMGGVETSRVTFRVLDNTGGPVAGQTVDFALGNNAGSTSLSSVSAVSGNDGQVSTLVQAGTTSGTVNVIASTSSPAISTQSGGITISTGVAEQNSISLSLSTSNPEGLTKDGTEVTVTVMMGDRMHNPVPDGTAAYFTTEGGVIESNCTTVKGECSVLWQSSNPRPVNGRSRVLVTAIGEESYNDVNADGFFSDGDIFLSSNDLAEAYRDDSENDSREANEEFEDFDSDGIYDLADGLFNGVRCTHSTLCAAENGLNVRSSQELVMSGSSLFLSGVAGSYTGSMNVTALLSDINGQTPPSGTEITISTSNGELLSLSSFTVPSNIDLGYPVGISVKADDEPSTGLVNIKAVVPSGLINYWSISFTD